jgi:hypothetical protein
MTRPRTNKRAGSKSAPPKRSYKLALWTLAVTLLILALKVLPYVDRW